MRTEGQHVLADVWLNEQQGKTCNEVQELVAQALKKSGMNVLGYKLHDFGDGAVTGVWLLAESHFSIHTFPERNYISIDCYTCGQEGDPLGCVATLLRALDVKDAKMRVLQRGD